MAIYGCILAGVLGSVIVIICLKLCLEELYQGNWSILCCPLAILYYVLYYGFYCCLFILGCPLAILYHSFYYVFCCCLCSKKSERDEECLGKNFDETVIEMEEPNYQFEDINGVRQDCRGPVGPSGTHGPSPAIPLPYLGFN